ncbi:MAG: phosphatidyl-myo-inositol alpha-mannosyltransferase [Actinomycetota bacterium]|nr:phosphatidyl-myo-inositol alpha-mannosyltransferase [Actinomycetota bacterium]
MRIGLVCPYSLTIPGGVQGQVLGLARALRGHGHEVRVLGPCDGPPPDAGVTSLGKSVPLAANGSIAPIAPDVSCALRTIRVLRDEAFDVVHLHEPLVPGPCMTTALMKPAPLIATFHAAGASAAYRIGGFALKILTNRLDLRCAVSEDAVALVGHYFGGEYEPVFNGIEVDRFAKASPLPECEEGPTVLFVGRHEERKGLAVLLDALDRLPTGSRIWVGGEGPQTNELRARVAGDPRVEWLGRIDDEEKCRRLRSADVFCAPSLHGESFGVVLLEAMAAGVPIVASDLPGYAKVGRQGREALLVTPGDACMLGDALARVLTDASLARSLVEGGRARADELSMDHLAELYLEKYTRIIDAPASTR